RLFYKHTKQEAQIPKNKKNKAVHQDVRYDRSYTELTNTKNPGRMPGFFINFYLVNQAANDLKFYI
ncbi:hypothetical protein VXE63_23050, partial [Acinetobacter nosocomialis]|uniref:hypothetical protein n=1 Tax=Acinetobacter nosocomialis TaxID=106654 RepID=UPI0030FB6EBD